ncbi:MAG: zinc ribbon domain-containing protein [Armatimonadetes bacterium]|nr:zinc ribbon domain-containing protein [Armatimonadota bacterium]
MPIFDYKCRDCQERFSLLIGVVAKSPEQRCPVCGGTNINRLISRFARLRSEDELLDSLADPSTIGDFEDPKQLHSWMKRMGKEMGEDLGEDFDQVLEEIETDGGEQQTNIAD